MTTYNVFGGSVTVAGVALAKVTSGSITVDRPAASVAFAGELPTEAHQGAYTVTGTIEIARLVAADTQQDALKTNIFAANSDTVLVLRYGSATGNHTISGTFKLTNLSATIIGAEGAAATESYSIVGNGTITPGTISA